MLGNGNKQSSPPPVPVRDSSSVGSEVSSSTVPEPKAVSSRKKEEPVTVGGQIIPKPKASYLELAARAILSVPMEMMLTSDIYDHVTAHHQYYRHCTKNDWKNNIRHNLSIQSCFVKVEKTNDGRGHYWGIGPDFIDKFRAGDFKIDKKSRHAKKGDDEKQKDEKRRRHSMPSAMQHNMQGNSYPFQCRNGMYEQNLSMESQYALHSQYGLQGYGFPDQTGLQGYGLPDSYGQQAMANAASFGPPPPPTSPQFPPPDMFNTSAMTSTAHEDFSNYRSYRERHHSSQYSFNYGSNGGDNLDFPAISGSLESGASVSDISELESAQHALALAAANMIPDSADSSSHANAPQTQYSTTVFTERMSAQNMSQAQAADSNWGSNRHTFQLNEAPVMRNRAQLQMSSNLRYQTAQPPMSSINQAAQPHMSSRNHTAQPTTKMFHGGQSQAAQMSSINQTAQQPMSSINQAAQQPMSSINQAAQQPMSSINQAAQPHMSSINQGAQPHMSSSNHTAQPTTEMFHGGQSQAAQMISMPPSYSQQPAMYPGNDAQGAMMPTGSQQTTMPPQQYYHPQS